VKAYTDYRVINKFIETLRTIKERLMPSDAFPFDLLYFGAHTGRWSGSGGFNMQNMRRQPLFCDDEGQLVTDPDKLQEIAKSKTQPNWVSAALDIRSLFIARPGKKLIVSDLSQIEPRVLAWTAEDKVMLEMLAEGQSPYEAHARATMGWKGGSMKKEDPSRYLLAKARVLGLGYGCGWEKFITVAYMMAGLDLTADDPEFIQAVDREGNPCIGRDGQPIMTSGRGHTSKKIVADYRENNPLITALWKEIDTAFRDSEGEDFEMTLPSGRVLRYPDVRRERKAVIDPVTRKVVHKWAFTALAFNNTRNTVMRQTFYGGLLTENWVQAFARDIFGEHLLALNSTDGMTPLWSVHDEAIVECDLSISAKDVQDVMSKTPDWAPGLPISAEAEEVPCYKK
jgi:DNA polymerase